MSLATLRNLAASVRCQGAMVDFGIVKALEVLGARTWADEDVSDDIESLLEVIWALPRCMEIPVALAAVLMLISSHRPARMASMPAAHLMSTERRY